MKRFISCIVASTMLAFSLPVWAEDPAATEMGDEAIGRLKLVREGDPAPFNGLLMDEKFTEKTTKLKADFNQCVDETTYLQEVIKAQDLTRDRDKKISFVLGVGAGVVGMSLLTIASVLFYKSVQ